MEDQLRQFLERLRQPPVYRILILLVLAGATVFLFTSYVVTAALVAGVAVVSWSVNKAGIKQIGIELATLSTVLVGVTYGAVPGAVAGLGLVTLQLVAGQYTGSYIVWVIPSYAVTGFIAGFFSGMDIFVLGTALTVGMQSLFATLTSVTAAGELSRYFPYAATNVIFNLFVFRYVAPLLLGLMA